MELVLLIPEYIVWHYTAAVRSGINIVSNFIWFVYHFFSVPIVGGTLFSPLHGVGKHFSNISRFLGFFMRVGLIFLAYSTILVIGLFGIVGMFFWLLLPLVVMGLVIHGFQFLFS